LNGGGLEFWYNNLDYLFNPRKGITVKSNVSLGQRKVIKNQEILALKSEKFDFANAYDTINLRNIQFGVDIDLAYYLPVSNWAVNKFSLTSGLKYNNDRVVENELYRLGGNRLMRGFDELTLLTNFYAVTTSEFRLILDQNSFLSLPFIDFGFLQSDSRQLKPKGVLVMGIGLGMNFSTKAGIFNISFASGNYDLNGFDFANTKIHFGYVNLF
jgi:hemolysin activation/secretion protein